MKTEYSNYINMLPWIKRVLALSLLVILLAEPVSLFVTQYDSSEIALYDDFYEKDINENDKEENNDKDKEEKIESEDIDQEFYEDNLLYFSSLNRKIDQYCTYCKPLLSTYQETSFPPPDLV